MLNSLPVQLLVGTVLGFLSGLGIGGGSLLILWLTAVLDTDPTTARGINLLFFLPSALIACRFRKKQGQLEWRPLLPAIVSGCAAAAAFAWLGSLFDTAVLKRLFGGLLILTGIRELLYKPKNKAPE